MSIKDSTSPIYLKNNNLYFINEVNKHIRLYNNIFTYSYIKDILGCMHICCLDLKGKLIYITYRNKSIHKKFIYKCNIKNLESIKLNLFNNFLNIFITRYNENKSFDVIHIKYNLLYSTYDKFTLTNLLFNNLSCYISDYKTDNILILELKYTTNEINIENKFCFSFNNNSWCEFNSVFLNSSLFNYHKSLTYK